MADRDATHYMGSPGAGVEGAQQWQAVEAPPVNPLDAAGPGKRKVPWSGEIETLACCAVLCLNGSCAKSPLQPACAPAKTRCCSVSEAAEHAVLHFAAHAAFLTVACCAMSLPCVDSRR